MKLYEEYLASQVTRLAMDKKIESEQKKLKNALLIKAMEILNVDHSKLDINLIVKSGIAHVDYSSERIQVEGQRQRVRYMGMDNKTMFPCIPASVFAPEKVEAYIFTYVSGEITINHGGTLKRKEMQELFKKAEAIFEVLK